MVLAVVSRGSIGRTKRARSDCVENGKNAHLGRKPASTRLLSHGQPKMALLTLSVAESENRVPTKRYVDFETAIWCVGAKGASSEGEIAWVQAWGCAQRMMPLS